MCEQMSSVMAGGSSGQACAVAGSPLLGSVASCLQPGPLLLPGLLLLPYAPSPFLHPHKCCIPGSQPYVLPWFILHNCLMLLCLHGCHAHVMEDGCKEAGCVAQLSAVPVSAS